MSDEPASGALSGRRGALPETRELDRLAQMLEEQGAETVRCPLVAIKDAPDPVPIQEWLKRLPFDDLVLFTGEGLRRLHQAGQLPDTTDPDALAVTLLATLQGGLLLAQVQRDPRPLETAVDTLLQLARSGRPATPAGNEIPLRDRPR